MTRIIRSFVDLLPGQVWFVVIVFLIAGLRGPLNSLTPEQRLDRIFSWAPSLLVASLAIGLISMAFIESIKRPIRGAFHRREIRDWLTDEGRDVSGYADHYYQLLFLVAPRYRSDVVGLPIEQLSAQLANVFEPILARPREYRVLLLALVGRAGKAEVEHYIEVYSPEESAKEVSSPTQTSELVDVRNALNHMIQRSLDAFQIHVTASWTALLKMLAIAVAVALASAGGLVLWFWEAPAGRRREGCC
jgi:hypothetical protein